jgi:flagellar basal-body rod modification protein FlgD
MQVNSSLGMQDKTANTAMGQQSDMFMKLLLAQLRSQDPMSPMDANSFVNQMVQFNTLDQITQIRQLVESLGVVNGSSEK